MSRITLKLVALCGLSFLLFACNNVEGQNGIVEKISENRAVKDRSQLPAYTKLTDSERERVDSIAQTTAFLNYQRVFQNYLEKSVKSVNELSADEQKAYFQLYNGGGTKCLECQIENSKGGAGFGQYEDCL